MTTRKRWVLFLAVQYGLAVCFLLLSVFVHKGFLVALAVCGFGLAIAARRWFKCPVCGQWATGTSMAIGEAEVTVHTPVAKSQCARCGYVRDETTQ